MKDAVAYVNQWTDNITKVEAVCKKHGVIEPDEWDADDFDWEERTEGAGFGRP